MSYRRCAERLKKSAQPHNSANIYVDLDETLVSHIRYENRLVKKYKNIKPDNEHQQEHWEIMNNADFVITDDRIPNTTFFYFVRPKAREFLEVLRSLGSIKILTAGDSGFQSEVVNKANFGSIEVLGTSDFTDVYGNVDPITKTDVPWVLIDDLPPGSSGFSTKMEILDESANEENHYVHVDGWRRRFGRDATDIMRYTNEVKSKLEAQRETPSS